MSRQYSLNRPAAPALHIDYAALLNPQQHEAVRRRPGLRWSSRARAAARPHAQYRVAYW